MGSKFDWKQIVSTVAPGIATALGGPLAGVAVQELSNQLLGHANGAEADVSAAVLAGGGDALLKIKQAEQEFQEKMAALGLDLERIAAGDRADSRQREIATGDHWTLRTLAALIVGSFIGVVWQVLFGTADHPINSVLAGTLIGYLSAKADQVISYYFGSSASSARKDKMLAESVPADSK